ncbi:MAG: iron-sulfur cluster assembly accessory protein [Leptolyngbyaceae cyanobacterium bins.59]|nr:iron-sulfur cluster assembly accessory protein [Leptolyngbyaceae cyanobacterium bins.59]
MIQLSQSAIREVMRLQTKQKAEGAQFRLQVKPGGCAGLSYWLGFDRESQPGDHHYAADEIQVVVDPLTLKHVQGLTLDYSEDLMGGAFRFHNPNAAKSCDCGISFSLKAAE